MPTSRNVTGPPDVLAIKKGTLSRALSLTDKIQARSLKNIIRLVMKSLFR